ncbi:MAG: hypothetical protein KAW12_07060 [Candidatus Aminicenantes bacterium]|nr:hypothetical protein [Candidatus Aminicenantes bacterium]
MNGYSLKLGQRVVIKQRRCSDAIAVVDEIRPKSVSLKGTNGVTVSAFFPKSGLVKKVVSKEEQNGKGTFYCEFAGWFLPTGYQKFALRKFANLKIEATV